MILVKKCKLLEYPIYKLKVYIYLIYVQYTTRFIAGELLFPTTWYLLCQFLSFSAIRPFYTSFVKSVNVVFQLCSVSACMWFCQLLWCTLSWVILPRPSSADMFSVLHMSVPFSIVFSIPTCHMGDQGSIPHSWASPNCLSVNDKRTVYAQHAKICERKLLMLVDTLLRNRHPIKDVSKDLRK